MDPITTVIIGRPASGKTTLINKILREGCFESVVHLDHTSSDDYIWKTINTEKIVKNMALVFDDINTNDRDNNRGIVQLLTNKYSEQLRVIIATASTKFASLFTKSAATVTVTSYDLIHEVMKTLNLSPAAVSLVNEQLEYYHDTHDTKYTSYTFSEGSLTINDNYTEYLTARHNEHIANITTTKIINNLFNRMIIPNCIIHAKDKVKSACVKNNALVLIGLPDLSSDEREYLQKLIK